MELDRNGLEVMDRDECLTRLATMSVARIGLSMRALPVIMPVNFVIDGDEIIIRTTSGAKTEVALRGAVVAVEADDYDPFAHTGWSVLVQGRARLVQDSAEVARLHEVWLSARSRADTDRWIAIATEIVTGRRIAHRDLRRPDRAGRGDIERLGARVPGRTGRAGTRLRHRRA